MNDSPSMQTFSQGYTLPIFVTRSNKYAMGLLLYALSALLYLTSNHYHLNPPRFLPMSWIDLTTPFLPYSVWVYTSEYLFFAAIYAFSKDMTNLTKYFYSFLALQVISVFIFWTWPTTYPRDNFPLPAGLDFLTRDVFTSLRHADTPANCCPSLHVSSVYLSAFIYLDEQREKFPYFFLWATAIAVSTLTTKQHYLVDVISGFVIASVLYWAFHRKVAYRK